MDPTLMALIMSLMGGNGQGQGFSGGYPTRDASGNLVWGSGSGQGYPTRDASGNLVWGSGGNGSSSGGYSGSDYPTRDASGNLVGGGYGNSQGQGYNTLYGYGAGGGYGGGYDQPYDPGHTMLNVPAYDPNAVKGTFDPRYVTGKTGGGSVLGYGRPTMDAYGRMVMSGSDFISGPAVDMSNARQAPSDYIPAYDANAYKPGVSSIATGSPILNAARGMGIDPGVGFYDPTAPDPRFTYQNSSGGTRYAPQAATTNSGYTGGYNGSGYAGGYNGGGYTGGGGYGQGYSGGYPTRDASGNLVMSGGGYNSGSQSLLQSLLTAFFGGNGSSYGMGNTTSGGNQYTGNTYSGSTPYGVNPGLWAASGGTGGLTTAQGGYSQDQNFWDNMNKIAAGTQTYTPWTQATLPAGTHAKPARSGFYGIPVPIENTIAAGWS